MKPTDEGPRPPFSAHEERSPIWIYPKVDPDWVQSIIREFQIHPVIAQVLAARPFKTLEEIHHYLYAQLPHLHSPHLFPDMDKAVERVLQALKREEAILIYGDNDVDGMSATALLTEFLQFIGAKVFYFVSHRPSLRRSVMLDAIAYASEQQCRLIITADCGITAAAEAHEAREKKIDIIVTDHHEPTTKLPHCVATLNPKLHGSSYPNRDLTGVGVAFKLAHAIADALINNGEISANKIDLKRYLDLVALGTIADMGALMGENRIFVRYGLKQLRRARRVGLLHLFSVCELKAEEVTPLDIASKVAPRLNSLGRIADPRKGVELLLLRDADAAEALAKELDLNNIERQRIERRDQEDIERTLLQHPELLKAKGILLASDKWHPGIIPIITARIAKQYNRPTVVIAIEEGVGKGSMRTIREFPLLPVLKEAASLLINFGGHDFAAGLTIEEANIPKFKDIFLREASRALQEQDIHPKLLLDAPIHFTELTFDFLDSLSLLEPYGNENPPPLFYCEAKQVWPPKVVGKMHLKLFLEENERLLEAIGFGMAGKKRLLGKKGQN